MLAGGAVAVGLPILDVMLNDNGDAFAGTDQPLPTRLFTWFWPLGLGEGDYVPKGVGADYELPAQCAALKPFQSKLNYFTGGQVYLDGHVNGTHFTGVQGIMTGTVGKVGEYFGSLDSLVADVIGSGTRFRSLAAICSGEASASWSARSDSGVEAAEISPSAMYARIFGAEYRDPNAASFTPDPDVMLRRSALSGVSDERNKLMRVVPASDRAKLDSYFTSLRTLEHKLDVQLEKPAPLAACTKASEGKKDDGRVLTLAEEAMGRHEVFTHLYTHAFACDQTRVANLYISGAFSGLRREGDAVSHHTYTHEEPIDPKLGYQPICGWFQQRYMRALHDIAFALSSVQEGDRTLLDRTIVFAFTDHGAPRVHSLKNYPLFTVGSGNGRLKTGLHVSRPGDAATRVSFTIQQAMGVSASGWGSASNAVNSPISDVLA
jgi:hypothetical protein